MFAVGAVSMQIRWGEKSLASLIVGVALAFLFATSAGVMSVAIITDLLQAIVRQVAE